MYFLGSELKMSVAMITLIVCFVLFVITDCRRKPNCHSWPGMRKMWRGPLLLIALVTAHSASSSQEHECRLVRTDNLKEICRSTPAGEDLVKFIIWKIEFEICSCSDNDKFLMKIAVPGAENLITSIWDGHLTQARSNEQSKSMYGQFTSDTISISNFTKYYKDKQAHIFFYPTSAVDQGSVSLPSASLFVSCKIILTS